MTRVERQADVGAALESLGVQPDARWSRPAQAYSQHRETTESDYYYVYNPTPHPIAFEPSFGATGRPYEMDLWTGAISPLAEYRASGGRVTVPLSLAPGENVVLGFRKGERGATPHVVDTNAEKVVELGDGSFEVRDTRAGRRSLRFSDGGAARVRLPRLPATVRPSDWDLIVEEEGPEESPPTHDLDLTGLPDWRSIDELAYASGVGTYTTTVTLPAGWTAPDRGTYLDPGRVAGGSTQVHVNGRLASPSPVAGERIDVSSLLR
ncbi:MAG: hypothetical protein GEU88_20290, partial [Solirubrobacterales bacterium]|nr:hypothetical protein [Solirubrobacterales bacterium]